MIRLTKQFRARNPRGEVKTLCVYTTFIDAGDGEDPNEEIAVSTRILTLDGDHVNRIKQGEYEVVATREVLTSDDSDAF